MAITVNKPLVKTKLSDAVADELEKMIREGEFLVGDAVPSERDLMSMFSVGRPSVREGLAKLERKGMVKIRSGERTRVTRPSPDHIISELSVLSKDFLKQPAGIKYFDQLRMFFESSLVRHAAEFANKSDIETLSEALEKNHRAIGNVDLFKKTDINFHRVLAEIPNNPIFHAVSSALADWVVTDRPIKDDMHAFHTRSYKDHEQIFNMIRTRNVEGADEAMKKHLQFVCEHYYQNQE